MCPHFLTIVNIINYLTVYKTLDKLKRSRNLNENIMLFTKFFNRLLTSRLIPVYNEKLHKIFLAKFVVFKILNPFINIFYSIFLHHVQFFFAKHGKFTFKQHNSREKSQYFITSIYNFSYNWTL